MFEPKCLRSALSSKAAEKSKQSAGGLQFAGRECYSNRSLVLRPERKNCKSPVDEVAAATRDIC